MSRRTDTDMQAAYARRLKVARIGRGYKVSDFCRALDITTPRYAAWEKGTVPNTIRMVRDVCNLLGVTADWLFLGSTTGLTEEARDALRRGERELVEATKRTAGKSPKAK